MTRRLDRTGEPVSDDEGARPVHDPRCNGGWLTPADSTAPLPCLQCKPHLRRLADVNDFGKGR